MNDHDKLMLTTTARALQPQATQQAVKVVKHKIAHGKRIRMLQARPLRQFTHRDGTRHAFDAKGNQV
jgi:hypothetical protein